MNVVAGNARIQFVIEMKLLLLYRPIFNNSIGGIMKHTVLRMVFAVVVLLTVGGCSMLGERIKKHPETVGRELLEKIELVIDQLR